MGLTTCIALKEPIVYYVDAAGRATYGGRLEEQSHPRHVEVSYVTKRFLEDTLAYNSLSVEEDFEDAYLLMTSEMQASEDKRFAAWQKDRGRSFVEDIQVANVETAIQFDRLDIEAHGDTQFVVSVRGKLATRPLDAPPDAEPARKEFQTRLVLLTAKRTESAPNGLLVAAVNTTYAGIVASQ